MTDPDSVPRCSCLCPESTHTGPGGHCTRPECTTEPCTPITEVHRAQRHERYARAITEHLWGSDEARADAVEAVLLVADDEQASLRTKLDKERGRFEACAHEASDAAQALARVRAHHQPHPEGGIGHLPDGSYGEINPACTACGTHDEYAVPWPCPTIRALDAPQAGDDTTGETP